MPVNISGTTVIDDSRNITNAVSGSFSSTVTVATPTASTHAATKAYVDAAASAGGVPSGTIITFSASTAPTGYLKANGAAVSRTTYAALFAAIGTQYGAGNGSTTFNVPDLRGEFVRGWDDARGVDTGRTFGSFQNQDYLSHNHGVSDPGHTHGGSTDSQGNHNHSYSGVGADGGGGGNARFGSGYNYSSSNTSSAGTHSHTLSISSATTGISISASGGTETRPRNLAMLACIKF